MAKVKRLTKSFMRLLLPVVILVVVATSAASVWLVHETSRPINTGYLVTPEKYGLLSSRGAQVSEEKWQAKDGVTQHGWLLRGEPNLPAVILLHKYGANRSHLLNLGVKLNEATNFTVLMPDLRGHGNDGQACTFGGCESEDVSSMVDYLNGLTTADGQFQLIGGGVGIYGLEMGGLSALATATHPDVKAVALDSIPADSAAVLSSAIGKRFPFASNVTEKLGRLGAYAYYYDGCYKRTSACDMAKQVTDKSVLLLAGADAKGFQESTSKLSKCFPNSVRMDSKTDLSPSGMNILNASLETSEAYDQRVIDFFRNTFASQPH